MKHQKVGCGGSLYHREHPTYDWYKCDKCGTTWTKKKRQKRLPQPR